jgi:hypothetical protein
MTGRKKVDVNYSSGGGLEALAADKEAPLGALRQ